MSHLIDITNLGLTNLTKTDKFGGLFLSDEAKKESNKYRSLLIGEKTSLDIEQDFMIMPDLGKNLMSVIKGKIYKEDY